MDIIIILLMFFIVLVPVAVVANKIGEKIGEWFEKHFPDVEE